MQIECIYIYNTIRENLYTYYWKLLYYVYLINYICIIINVCYCTFFLVLQYCRFSCSFPIILFFCHLHSHIFPSPPLYCPQEHFCPQYYSSLFYTHRKQTNPDCVVGHVAEHNENLRPQESLKFITKVNNCHPHSSKFLIVSVSQIGLSCL